MQPVVIAGAGIIGLSIALELRCRGVGVSVLDTGKALRQASTAAAGMLASEDPHNPPHMLEIARYSRQLYPEFLARIEALSGLTVPLQTAITVQYHSGAEAQRLPEHSLDPRQLAEALLAAVRASGIDLREDQADDQEMSQFEPSGDQTLIIAAGAWSGLCSANALPIASSITPCKGQMLRVSLPPALRGLREVHRAEHVYIVPRTQGPQAGTALLGATVEDVGFDTAVDPTALARLRALAARLLPALASEEDAPMIEAWAGLRPATPDGLPLLGRIGGTFVATGHFRNGILLAPATAHIIADLIQGKPPAVEISAFAPQRFSS